MYNKIGGLGLLLKIYIFMIKAVELIKISEEHSKEKIEKCLNEIQERIKNAAENGQFSYTYNGNKYMPGFLHYIAKLISKFGYKVTYTNSILEITWYETEAEQTKSSQKEKTEVDKQNKSMQKSEGNKTAGKDTSILSDSKRG